MLFAGIAWSGQGFDVAVRSGADEPAAGSLHVPAGQLAALTAHLRDLAAGDELVCVVDSTDGMIDGGLMAAGLRVHRADPWVLPPRPEFGSVEPDALARAGATRLAELPRLVLESGSLTGRDDDHVRYARSSDAELAALIAAGRALRSAPGDDADPVVALTFDDGPNPPYTGRVLDVLERYGIPATFFCVGLHASAHTEELARMAEAGHCLGNHTWSHPFLPDLSVREFEVQLERTFDAIEDGAGAPSAPLFRPPYGSRKAELLTWLGRSGGPTTVLWDVDTEDWAMPGAAAITGAVLGGVRPGSIVLMHDGGGDRSQTAEALPAVIEGLLDRGYRFAAVPDLIGAARPR